MKLKSEEANHVEEPVQYALDDILSVVGKFGPYQLGLYALICCGTLISSSYSLGFVFTAGEMNYRCHVPECEDFKSGEYHADWLPRAVPFDKNLPKSCVRYAPKTQSTNTCSAENFDESTEIECTDLIFENYENTVVNEFNLTCKDQYLVALIGTVHFTGHFINLLVSGYLSDVYGRRIVFICSTFAGGVLAIIRSFTWNYLSFIIVEFLDTLIVSGVYTAGFIMAVEILSPELRALGGVLLFVGASMGAAITGLLAWWLRDWRVLLRVNNIPALILGTLCIFFLPESFRWLLAQGQNKMVAKHLLTSSRVNGTELPSDIKEVLEHRPEDILLDTQDASGSKAKPTAKYNLAEIFQYPIFLARIAICAYCWLTNIFVYFGLNLTAVAIGGNKYTDFVYVSLIEIPALFFVMVVADRLGRKVLLVSALFLSGIALLTSTFVPDIYWINLLLFLVGKFAITVSFSIIYTLTSEIFPTNFRHTLLGFCSGFGRLGSVIATQASILQTVNKFLPMYLFAGTALLAGFLSLTFPETKNLKLPDTIYDALNIGKLKIKSDQEIEIKPINGFA